MRRKIGATLALSLSFTLAAPELPRFSTAAQAQQARQQGGFRLFFPFAAQRREVPPHIIRVQPPPPRIKRPRKPKRAKVQEARPKARAKPSRPARMAPAAPAVAAPALAKKQENAKTILVLGDFFAGNLAKGLDQLFAEREDIRIVDRSNGSSGLVREDFYNWREAVQPILDEVKPDIVAMMVGANDRQPIQTASGSAAVRSDAWQAAYQERAEGLARQLVGAQAPVLWVGLPPMQSQSYTSDVAYMNDVFERTMAKVGGRFVDVWEGFLDGDGKYTSHGPDHTGQRRQLRGSDGILLTQAGRTKLAFYAAEEIKRFLEGAPAPTPVSVLAPEADTALTSAEPDQLLFGPEDLASQEVLPQPTVREVPLTGPGALSAGQELVGGAPALLAAVPSPRNQTPQGPKPGRIDDWSGPRALP